MRFLVNGPSEKQSGKGPAKRRRSRSAASRRAARSHRNAEGAAMARKRKKRTAGRAAGARRTYRKNAPAKAKRSARSYRRNPARGRRSYRRNPPILAAVKRGLLDAAGVTGGKAVYNLARKNLPFALPIAGVAGELLTGILVAGLGAFAVNATGLVKGDVARLVTAGLFQGVVEGGLRALNVPMVTDALGSYDNFAGTHPQLMGYPRAAPVLPAGRPLAAYDDSADEFAMMEQQY